MLCLYLPLPFPGTVHLEALEMLSARCRSRVSAAKSRVDEAAGIVLDMVEVSVGQLKSLRVIRG